MTDMDEMIRAALKNAADSEELLKERSMLAEILSPFRGKRRWVNFVGIAYGLVANGILVWAAIRFFNTDVTNDRLMWLAIAGFATLLVAFSKVYFWMEMHTNRVLREVKRVELLVLQKRDEKEH